MKINNLMASPRVEEIVYALMEKLVNCYFHCSSSTQEQQQKAIPTQLHALILLYNVFHRMQKKPEQVKFLDFESFRDLFLSLQPSLAPFISQTPLSLTVKSMRDACAIASALDANTQEFCNWPISKVAVLLVDSKKENCRLQFGAITQGVWSLFEKEIVCNDDKIVLGTVYDIVKEMTGLESKQMVILGTHVVYSLSKKESATKLFLIQLPHGQTIDPRERIPLELLVERLQGPLAEYAFGSWATTEVVSYYHMLPYMNFISNWLSGKELFSPNIRVCSKEHDQSIISVSPALDHTMEGSHNDSNNAGKTPSYDDETAKKKNSTDDYNKKRKHSSDGVISMADVKMKTSTKHKDDIELIYQRRETAKKNATNKFLYIANSVKEMNEHEKGSIVHPPSNKLSQSQRIEKDNLVDLKKSTKPCSTPVSAAIEGTVENDYRQKVLHSKECSLKNMEADVSDTPKFDKKSDIITVSVTINEECGTPAPNTRGQPIASSTQIDDNHGGTTLNVKFVDTMAKSVNNNECAGGKKVTGESCGIIAISPVDQNDKPADNKSQQGCSQVEASITNLTGVRDELTSSTEELQNAVALLCHRRQQLFSQLCRMKDTLARYEDGIQRIRDGGEVCLARRCIESIIRGDNHWMLKDETVMQDQDHYSNSQTEIQISSKLSDIYVIGKSRCKDLEYMCCTNNWRLPSYFIELSEGGKYQSSVVVWGKDFKLASGGDMESSPIEARESAAAHMIDKIRDYATED